MSRRQQQNQEPRPKISLEVCLQQLYVRLWSRMIRCRRETGRDLPPDKETLGGCGIIAESKAFGALTSPLAFESSLAAMPFIPT